MSGAAFTPEELAIGLFLYLVLPLAMPTLVGGVVGRRMEDVGMGPGLLIGAIVSVLAFLVTALWWGSGLVTVRVPWGLLDEDFFLVPIFVTTVAVVIAWVAAWFWSQRE